MDWISSHMPIIGAGIIVAWGFGVAIRDDLRAYKNWKGGRK